MSSLKSFFDKQVNFHKKIININDLLDEEKEDITKSLALALHAEVSSLISATNYKSHVKLKKDVDLDKILFESVDVLRYVIAILNTWGITYDAFEKAFDMKDTYLNLSHEISQKTWQRQPVAIVDMDDVIVDFRRFFANWIENKYNIKIDIEIPEYYFVTDLVRNGINPENIFGEFIEDGGLAKINAVEGANDFLKFLKSEGYWIQLLTARPSDNLRCLYDTYSWLALNNICFDEVSFSTEKFRWCATSKYYDSNSIAFAIDDSPKHITDYFSHKVPVYAPVKPYNKHQTNIDKNLVRMYNSFSDLKNLITNKTWSKNA